MKREGRRFADFIVIGAQKAGTTSLFHYLDDHPQVYLHPKKELAFFARPDQRDDPSKYAEFFRRAPADAVLGDISTQYAKHPLWQGVAPAIATLLPQVRLIYMVRHPVKRAFSHYHHEVLGGHDLPPLDEEVRRNPIYIQISSYYMQLEHYLPHFDPEQILIVPMEEMFADQRSWVRRIFMHIGCDPDYVPTNLEKRSNVSEERVQITPIIRKIQNSRPYRAVRWRLPSGLKRRVVAALGAPPPPKPKMSPETAAWLADQLRDDAEKLRQFLGRDTPLWDL
jgi:hypothetical protein